MCVSMSVWTNVFCIICWAFDQNSGLRRVWLKASFRLTRSDGFGNRASVLAWASRGREPQAWAWPAVSLEPVEIFDPRAPLPSTSQACLRMDSSLVSLWMMLLLKEDEVAEVVETSHAWECQEEDAGPWSPDRAIFRTWKMLSQAWPVVNWLPRCWTRLER